MQNPDVLHLTPEAIAYRIEIFAQADLLKQPFLPQLRDVINASYHDPGVAGFEKVNPRLENDTQLAELKETGFTAIAFNQDEILGTASLRLWEPYAEGAVWKSRGYFEQFHSEDICGASSALLNSLDDESHNTVCGEFELAAVGIVPDLRYRKRGIAEKLVRACEEEVLRRTGLSELRITLKVVRQVAGDYWLNKGFRIIGEQYCPPLTWGSKTGFVLWAMERTSSAV